MSAVPFRINHLAKASLVIPILAITRRRLNRFKQFPSRITHRDRRLKFLQIGFQKMVRDDLSMVSMIASSWRTNVDLSRPQGASLSTVLSLPLILLFESFALGRCGGSVADLDRRS
jgi:hypothetical protein